MKTKFIVITLLLALMMSLVIGGSASAYSIPDDWDERNYVVYYMGGGSQLLDQIVVVPLIPDEYSKLVDTFFDKGNDMWLQGTTYTLSDFMDEEQAIVNAQWLDSVMYPHGLDLPTKWLDTFSLGYLCQPYVVTSMHVMRFLRENYPLTGPGDMYTYAEIKAAELYYTLYCLSTDGFLLKNPDSEDVNLVKEMTANGQLKLIDGELYTVKIADPVKFWERYIKFIGIYTAVGAMYEMPNWMENYSNMGFMETESSEPYRSFMGFDPCFYSFGNGQRSQWDNAKWAEWIGNIPRLMEDVGLEYEKVESEELWTLEKIAVYNGLPLQFMIDYNETSPTMVGNLGPLAEKYENPNSVNVKDDNPWWKPGSEGTSVNKGAVDWMGRPIPETEGGGAADSDGSENASGEDTGYTYDTEFDPELTPEDVNDQTGIYNPSGTAPWIPETGVNGGATSEDFVNSTSGDDYSFESGITSDDAVEKKFGFMDFLTWACVVVCGCAVASIFVVTYLKKKNDKTNSWKK